MHIKKNTILTKYSLKKELQNYGNTFYANIVKLGHVYSRTKKIHKYSNINQDITKIKFFNY